MSGSLVRFRGTALLFVVALMAGLFGLSGRAVAQGQTRNVMIRTLDFAFDAPAQIEAGITSFTMRNDGQEPHHAQLARLQDGKTIDDLVAALQSGNEGAIFALLEFTGGPGVAAPGTQVAAVTMDLRVGAYVWMCFIASPDGAPHFAKGMLKPMQVVAATGQAPVAPTTDGTVVLQDFRFEMPATVNAGMQTWKISNAGPQPHEIALVRLNPGKTLADALAPGGSGPPPYTSLGGMQALSAGNSGWVTLDLQPATYVAICFIPDPASSKTHAELGMVAQFTVAAPAGTAPLPDTGEEAPFPSELPNTGMDSGLSLVLMFLALVLVGAGMTLRRRRA